MKNIQEFLRKNMELAASDYKMIDAGDRILVGISGGADSLALLKLLTLKKIFVPDDIEILAIHLDLGFTDDNREHIQGLEEYFAKIGCEYHIEKTDIGPYAHSDENLLNPCFLCSRIRRTKIFKIADERGCNKIAYGHHKDDIIETLLLNIFFGREISTMKPKQPLFDGRFHIIRPLAYVREDVIKEYATQEDFPVFDNDCPTSGSSKRQYIKDLLNSIEKDHPSVKKNIFNAMKRVKTDYLL